jgi:hypothetical protein
MTFPGAETMNAGIKGVELRRCTPNCRDNSAWTEPFEVFASSGLLAFESVGLVDANSLARRSCSFALMSVCDAIVVEKSG